MLGEFSDLELGLLKRPDVVLVQLFAGGGADPMEPLVVCDRVVTEATLLILALLRVDLSLGELVVKRRRRGRVRGGFLILLQSISAFAAIQVALSDGDSLEGLAALEGGLVAVLLAAHEPPQILKGEGPHGAAPQPISAHGSIGSFRDLCYLEVAYPMYSRNKYQWMHTQIDGPRCRREAISTKDNFAAWKIHKKNLPGQREFR